MSGPAAFCHGWKLNLVFVVLLIVIICGWGVWSNCGWSLVDLMWGVGDLFAGVKYDRPPIALVVEVEGVT